VARGHRELGRPAHRGQRHHSASCSARSSRCRGLRPDWPSVTFVTGCYVSRRLLNEIAVPPLRGRRACRV
jgi:hypothetical protein